MIAPVRRAATFAVQIGGMSFPASPIHVPLPTEPRLGALEARIKAAAERSGLSAGALKSRASDLRWRAAIARNAEALRHLKTARAGAPTGRIGK